MKFVPRRSNLSVVSATFKKIYNKKPWNFGLLVKVKLFNGRNHPLINFQFWTHKRSENVEKHFCRLCVFSNWYKVHWYRHYMSIARKLSFLIQYMNSNQYFANLTKPVLNRIGMDFFIISNEKRFDETIFKRRKLFEKCFSKFRIWVILWSLVQFV